MVEPNFIWHKSSSSTSRVENSLLLLPIGRADLSSVKQCKANLAVCGVRHRAVTETKLGAGLNDPTPTFLLSGLYVIASGRQRVELIEFFGQQIIEGHAVLTLIGLHGFADFLDDVVELFIVFAAVELLLQPAVANAAQLVLAGAGDKRSVLAAKGYAQVFDDSSDCVFVDVRRIPSDVVDVFLGHIESLPFAWVKMRWPDAGRPGSAYANISRAFVAEAPLARTGRYVKPLILVRDFNSLWLFATDPAVPSIKAILSWYG